MTALLVNIGLFCAGTTLLIAGLMAFRRIPRWGGALLLALYLFFVGAPLV